MNQLKISIITVTFNSQKTLKDTLSSILEQDYSNIELVIVDGLSTDSTLGIIQDYQEQFEKKSIQLQLISEKDQGIYDAMNKGIALATGDVIGFLNSDDYFYSAQSLTYIATAFQTYHTDCVFGNLCLINQEHQILRYWIGSHCTPYAFFLGWHPAHPTFYVKKEIFQQYGVFKLEYKVSADYDLMLRFLQKHHISSYYIPHYLVKMRVGGVSNASIKHIFNANLECVKSWQKNQLSNFPLFVCLKPMRKLASAIMGKIRKTFN